MFKKIDRLLLPPIPAKWMMLHKTNMTAISRVAEINQGVIDLFCRRETAFRKERVVE